jgi:hypothetical protein
MYFNVLFHKNSIKYLLPSVKLEEEPNKDYRLWN